MTAEEPATIETANCAFFRYMITFRQPEFPGSMQSHFFVLEILHISTLRSVTVIYSLNVVL
jgi:hypothetical protein